MTDSINLLPWDWTLTLWECQSAPFNPSQAWLYTIYCDIFVGSVQLNITKLNSLSVKHIISITDLLIKVLYFSQKIVSYVDMIIFCFVIREIVSLISTCHNWQLKSSLISDYIQQQGLLNYSDGNVVSMHDQLIWQDSSDVKVTSTVEGPSTSIYTFVVYFRIKPPCKHLRSTAQKNKCLTNRKTSWYTLNISYLACTIFVENHFTTSQRASELQYFCMFFFLYINAWHLAL